MRRIVLWSIVIAVGVALAIQVVPYGRDHANPTVVAEPAWDSARTRELAVTACFDCHSNETVWPWYSAIAPISWRLQNHVNEGREKLNFSEWGRDEQAKDEIVEVVRDGGMPPWDYLLTHPDARLSDGDRQALINGLAATFGGEDGDASGSEDD